MDSIRALCVLLLIIIGVIHISGVYVFPLFFILLIPLIAILTSYLISKYEGQQKEEI